MSILLYTISWDGYWDKYGQKFEEYVSKLETKPDQVIVVSDVPVNTSFENIICDDDKSTAPHWAFRNKAIEYCKCDWVVSWDLDDNMYPCYLNNLNYDYDIHAFSYFHTRDNGIADATVKIPVWNNYFSYTESVYVFPQHSPIKLKILNEVGGYEKYGFEDRKLQMKLKKHNASVYFDPLPRYKYNFDPNKPYPNRMYRETEYFFRQIKNNLI